MIVQTKQTVNAKYPELIKKGTASENETVLFQVIRNCVCANTVYSLARPASRI